MGFFVTRRTPTLTNSCRRQTGRGVSPVRDRLDGETVDEIVHRVAAVALHPAERHVAGLHQLDERLPQVDVGDGLLLGVLATRCAPTSPTTGR